MLQKLQALQQELASASSGCENVGGTDGVDQVDGSTSQSPVNKQSERVNSALQVCLSPPGCPSRLPSGCPSRLPPS